MTVRTILRGMKVINETASGRRGQGRLGVDEMKQNTMIKTGRSSSPLLTLTSYQSDFSSGHLLLWGGGRGGRDAGAKAGGFSLFPRYRNMLSDQVDGKHEIISSPASHSSSLLSDISQPALLLAQSTFVPPPSHIQPA